jgi:hypothetical protein
MVGGDPKNLVLPPFDADEFISSPAGPAISPRALRQTAAASHSFLIHWNSNYILNLEVVMAKSSSY